VKDNGRVINSPVGFIRSLEFLTVDEMYIF